MFRHLFTRGNKGLAFAPHKRPLIANCRICSGKFSLRSYSTSKSNNEKPQSLFESWRSYQFPAAAGILCLALIQLRRKTNEKGEEDIDGTHRKYQNFSLGLIVWGIPYRWISHLWGKLTNVELTFDWMKSGVYNLWTVLYDCKLDEMRYPLEEYKSLAEFFLRPLKDGVRPIDAQSVDAVVSPVDAVVLHTGHTTMKNIKNGNLMIEQVKGVSYSLGEFLGIEPQGMDLKAAENEKNEKRMQYIVLYLAPGDYHHFHSPVDWTISQRRHFPGALIPVRPWAVEKIPGLYNKNERVVLNGIWNQGYFGFVAVGALNVGSIKIVFDENIKTNQASSLPYTTPNISCHERNYPFEIPMVRGQPIGSFQLGSTIVLVFESSKEFEFTVKSGQAVTVGQRIGINQPSSPTRPAIFAPPWPNQASNQKTIDQLRQLAQ